MRPIHLALFFTRGLALRHWHELGTLERDIALYERLCALGYRVTFVTYGEPDDAEHLPQGSPITVLSRPKGWSLRRYARTAHRVHREALASADVIKSHQIHGATTAARVARRLGKPFMARCGYLPSMFAHASGAGLLRRMRATLEEVRAVRRAQAIAVPSQAEADYVAGRYRVSARRLHLCPNWVDTDRFRPGPQQRHQRRIAFVGRLEAQKQPLLFLELVRGLTQIEAVMIGTGRLEHKVAERVRVWGLPVRMLGRLNNEAIADELQRCAVYVFPTLCEGGSPKSLLEAMACGLPAVSTNAFGVREAFVHDAHGFQCRPDDLQGMREAVEYVLSNPARAQAMGQAARRHVISHYSLDRAVERETALLAELAAIDRPT